MKHLSKKSSLKSRYDSRKITSKKCKESRRKIKNKRKIQTNSNTKPWIFGLVLHSNYNGDRFLKVGNQLFPKKSNSKDICNYNSSTDSNISYETSLKKYSRCTLSPDVIKSQGYSLDSLDSNNLTPSSSINSTYSNSNCKSSNRSYSRSTSTVKIPKLIMQTWKTSQVPEHWKESPSSIHEIMPDWEYVLMTDIDNEEFCKKYFPDFLNMFKSFPHNIQRADAIRYLWLYVNGGLYMDLDIVVVKPLDSLFYSDAEIYLCSSGNVGSCITNSLMASKPGALIWLKMIEYMSLPPPWWAWGKHMEVMNTTGPVGLNHVVKTNQFDYLALPAKWVMPCSVCNVEQCDIGEAYLKPLVGSSWISWDTHVMNFFMCKWRYLIFGFILLIILIILFILVYRLSKRNRNRNI